MTITHCLTSSEATIDHLNDLGISVLLPENSVYSERESSAIEIRPCFAGPFQLPDDFEPASPTFFVHHDNICFRKAITIRMCHYAKLVSEEDCADMAFFTASSTPKYLESKPVYTFKQMSDDCTVFMPGDLTGEIVLRHFCFGAIAKKKRQSLPCKHHIRSHCMSLLYLVIAKNYYSARLYRAIEQQGVMSAMFCMTLESHIYTRVIFFSFYNSILLNLFFFQHCDAVFSRQYCGGTSVRVVVICEDEIKLYSNDPTGNYVKFDQTPTVCFYYVVDSYSYM